ncbi:MAG: hypothetical protein JW751_10860 [Polyangiaceae bacterium]|nr:hypothetical protein [Polyangiaceae bacterium]
MGTDRTRVEGARRVLGAGFVLSLLAGCFSTDRILGEVSGWKAINATGGVAGAPTGAGGTTSAVSGGAAGTSVVQAGGDGGADLDFRFLNAAVWVSDLGEIYVAGYVAEGPSDRQGFVARATPSGRQHEYWSDRNHELRAVVGCGDGGLIAIGDAAAIRDPSWSLVSVPGANLHALTARDCDSFVAVGDDGVALARSGSDWESLDTGTTVQLRAVAALPDGELVAVGREGTILRFDGVEWIPEASGTAEDLDGLWVPSQDLVYAVGGSAITTGIILAREAGSWHVALDGVPYNLQAIHGDDLGRTIVVGSEGPEFSPGIAMARTDGEWKPLPVDVPATLWDVRVPPFSYAVAVGPADTYVRFAPRTGGGVDQLPQELATCAPTEVGVLAYPQLAEPSPVLGSPACVDTTAALIVACVTPDLAGSFVGPARCVRHMASGIPYFTRAPIELLDGASWEPCALSAPDPCQSLRCAEPPPRHLCSPSAFCAKAGCDEGGLDALGCAGAPCLDDDACGPEEHCGEVILPAAGACFEDYFGDCSCGAAGGTVERRCISDG